MSKTKEEILQECGESKYGKPQYDGFKVNYAHIKDADFIFEAMSEYAKEQSIDFAEWYYPFRKEMVEQAAKEHDKQKFKDWLRKPISEYYKLFLEHQKQQQSI